MQQLLRHNQHVTEINSGLIALGSLFILIRLWARHCYSKASFAPDDLVAVISYVLTSICTGMQIGAYINMPTKPITPTDEEAIKRHTAMLKYYEAGAIIEPIAAGTMRLIYIFMYRRILCTWPNARRASLAFIAFIGVWMLAFFIAEVTVCGTHLNDLFLLDPGPESRQCGNRDLLQVIEAIFCPIMDLISLFLPMFYVANLKLRLRKKLWVCFLFSLGAA